MYIAKVYIDVLKKLYSMKLAGYYTSAKKVGFKSKNPKAVYINLSSTKDGDWLKTHAIINGMVIDIPRWVMTDYLRIGDILMPERRTVRFHKDRLTVSPELEGMLKESGYRYGGGAGQHARIGTPGLDTADVRELTFAERVRGGVQDGELTPNDMLKKILESFEKIRPRHDNDEAAFAKCVEFYGWNAFELSMALYWSKKGSAAER
jgi:hypothetical protein